MSYQDPKSNNNTPILPDEREDDPTSTVTFRQLPKGDILTDYVNEASPEKYDFLQAKYVFRFPFTLTSIKWGLVMGSLFGLHTYFKKKSITNSLYWFVMGGVITGFPIWGFFMLKYSFYTLSIRKFERDQVEQAEESNLMREYYIKKLKLKEDVTDEDLVTKLQNKQQEMIKKYSVLDQLEEDPEIFAEFNKYQENKENKEKKE